MLASGSSLVDSPDFHELKCLFVNALRGDIGRFDVSNQFERNSIRFQCLQLVVPVGVLSGGLHRYVGMR